MLRNLSVFFIFMAASNFFWFAMVPQGAIQALGFGAILFMLVVVLLGLIYDPSRRFNQYFTYEISLIFLALILSTIGAQYGHNQGFILTAWAQRVMYFYLFYFFLHTIRIKPEDLEKLMILISVLYIVFFILQYVSYPRLLFGTRVQEDRGTIRIFLPAKAFVILMYFYCLQKFFENLKWYYLVFVLASIAVTILQGTRMALALMLLGTVINLVVSKRVQSKMLMTFLLILAAVPIVWAFQDIFINLIEVSQEQSANEQEDIRVRAARFFLFEFSPTPLNFIIGNGESHMASAYGMEIFYHKIHNGFFQNDIGIIGEYSKYGLIYVVAVILIVRKILITKLPPKFMYFKYYIFVSLMGMLLGGIFARPDSYLTILVIMYIIDIELHERKYKLKEQKLNLANT